MKTAARESAALKPAPAPQPTDVAAAKKYVIDPDSGWQERPTYGTIGYTTSYREDDPEIVDVSVVSVLEARGPE